MYLHDQEMVHGDLKGVCFRTPIVFQGLTHSKKLDRQDPTGRDLGRENQP